MQIRGQTTFKMIMLWSHFKVTNTTFSAYYENRYVLIADLVGQINANVTGHVLVSAKEIDSNTVAREQSIRQHLLRHCEGLVAPVMALAASLVDGERVGDSFDPLPVHLNAELSWVGVLAVSGAKLGGDGDDNELEGARWGELDGVGTHTGDGLPRANCEPYHANNENTFGTVRLR